MSVLTLTTDVTVTKVYELVFTNTFSDVLSGQILDPAPTVRLRNTLDDSTFTASEADVRLSISEGPEGAILSGTTSRPIINGQAEFPGLVLPTIGTGYKLKAEIDDSNFIFPGYQVDSDTLLHVRWNSGTDIAINGIIDSEVSIFGSTFETGDSPIGLSANFDKVSALSVDINGSNEINAAMGEGFTAGFMIRAVFETTNQEIWMMPSYTSYDSLGLSVQNSSTGKAHIYGIAAVTTYIAEVQVDVSLEQWIRVCVTYRRSPSNGGQLDLFINGIHRDVDTTDAWHSFSSTGRHMGIGGNVLTGSGLYAPFAGSMADCFISKRVFSDEEILADAIACGVA